MKFDPTDQEILEHLEAKVSRDARKIHPLIDEFIPTLEGENGICYTHPEKLPGNYSFLVSNHELYASVHPNLFRSNNRLGRRILILLVFKSLICELIG